MPPSPVSAQPLSWRPRVPKLGRIIAVTSSLWRWFQRACTYQTIPPRRHVCLASSRPPPLLPLPSALRPFPSLPQAWVGLSDGPPPPYVRCFRARWRPACENAIQEASSRRTLCPGGIHQATTLPERRPAGDSTAQIRNLSPVLCLRTRWHPPGDNAVSSTTHRLYRRPATGVFNYPHRALPPIIKINATSTRSSQSHLLWTLRRA